MSRPTGADDPVRYRRASPGLEQGPGSSNTQAPRPLQFPTSEERCKARAIEHGPRLGKACKRTVRFAPLATALTRTMAVVGESPLPSDVRRAGSAHSKESDHERRSEAEGRRALHRCRHVPCRLGPQGDQDRRDRDARSDGDPRGVREDADAQGRAHHGLAAHDDPDRRARRDAAGARRRRALGLVQHLLDPGPRRRGARRDRHAGVRLQGRDARRLLGLQPTASSSSATRDRRAKART